MIQLVLKIRDKMMTMMVMMSSANERAGHPSLCAVSAENLWPVRRQETAERRSGAPIGCCRIPPRGVTEDGDRPPQSQTG